MPRKPASPSPAAPAPLTPRDAVWRRCSACRLVHAPDACRLTASHGVIADAHPPPVAPALARPAPKRRGSDPPAHQIHRERDAACAPPQVSGLVLPDDVLMLAQAAAGERDLIEWVCETIRLRATPSAVSVPVRSAIVGTDTLERTRRKGHGHAPTGTDTAPRSKMTKAERQALYRQSKAADPTARAAEAARKRAARAVKP